MRLRSTWSFWGKGVGRGNDLVCVCEISRQCRRGYHGLFFASSKSVYIYRCFFQTDRWFVRRLSGSLSCALREQEEEEEEEEEEETL